MPVEVMETRFPLLFDQFALDTPQEAGHGEFRGGTGLVQDYRLYNSSGGFITAGFGRSKFPPWGVEGGQDGDGNYIEILRKDEDDVERYSNLTNFDLSDGDVARLVTSAGGGWGDPYDRDPDRVLEDYQDDYLTRETSREVYGVVITGDDELDRAATHNLRTESVTDMDGGDTE
jgi:N-methylhydantoinase B